MSELFVNQPGKSGSVPPWSNIKPVIITLDSDDEDSDTEEDSSGLPGRSKATTDLASCSNTAVGSTSQSSLSSSSSESLRIAAWEQNVKATSGAENDKQAAVKDDTKATEVIDLTQDDDDTSEQSKHNKSFNNTSTAPQPLLSNVTAPIFFKPLYGSTPVVQKTLQYDYGYTSLSKTNENNFIRSNDDIFMVTNDEISTVGPLTTFGSFTSAVNMKAQQVLPMDTYESSYSMETETYPDHRAKMDINMDISRPPDYGHFNIFGLNNNSQACQEEAMELGEENSLFTTFAKPQILSPVYHFIADRPEPMEVDGTIRLPRAVSRATKTSVKVRRKSKKRDACNDYELPQKRRKF